MPVHQGRTGESRIDEIYHWALPEILILGNLAAWPVYMLPIVDMISHGGFETWRLCISAAKKHSTYQ
jgi:hypothetical protein